MFNFLSNFMLIIELEIYVYIYFFLIKDILATGDWII